MKLINSTLSKSILKTYKIEVGEFHFFQNMVIAEINEGIHMDFEKSKEHIQLIQRFYGNRKPFGYVCNRVNTFSVSPLDYIKFNNALGNLEIYGIIHSNHFDKLNFDVEKRFCNKPFLAFNDVESAYKNINGYLEKLNSNHLKHKII